MSQTNAWPHLNGLIPEVDLINTLQINARRGKTGKISKAYGLPGYGFRFKIKVYAPKIFQYIYRQIFR